MHKIGCSIKHSMLVGQIIESLNLILKLVNLKLSNIAELLICICFAQLATGKAFVYLVGYKIFFILNLEGKSHDTLSIKEANIGFMLFNYKFY